MLVVAGSVTTPSVPTLGRATEEAGQRAGQLLEVIDEVAQPKVKQATADEIFLGRTVLMLVEPGSLCWVGGRMVEARDGQTWAVEFARFSALSGVVRDNGSGLGKGLKLERARRGAEGQPDLEDSLDIFHTFGEGGRALRKTWARPACALERAEAAQKELDRLGRAGESRTGHATPTSRLWRQAEGLWDQAMAAERAWKLTRSAFEFFTPEGRFNDRQQAQAVVAAALRHLSGRHGPRPGGCCSAARASRSWTEGNGVWLSWDWTPTSCRPCWTWKACSAKPGDCRSQRPGQPRHGLGRWPARSNWRRQNPTGRN